jgi:hypothetical protein
METFSVYALGMNKIEIGKFRGTETEVVEWFEKECDKAKLSIKDKKMEANILLYKLEEDYEKTATLLYNIASVEDLHGDAPFEYEIEKVSDSGKGYTKTGSYYD